MCLVGVWVGVLCAFYVASKVFMLGIQKYLNTICSCFHGRGDFNLWPVKAHWRLTIRNSDTVSFITSLASLPNFLDFQLARSI